MQFFTSDFNVDVMKHSDMARNYTDVFQMYSFVKEINLSIYVSSSGGNATSSIDHIWHNLNSP